MDFVENEGVYMSKYGSSRATPASVQLRATGLPPASSTPRPGEAAASAGRPKSVTTAVKRPRFKAPPESEPSDDDDEPTTAVGSSCSSDVVSKSRGKRQMSEPESSGDDDEPIATASTGHGKRSRPHPDDRDADLDDIIRGHIDAGLTPKVCADLLLDGSIIELDKNYKFTSVFSRRANSLQKHTHNQAIHVKTEKKPRASWLDIRLVVEAMIDREMARLETVEHQTAKMIAM